MNYYQQNNSLTQFTSINIVNVTFYVVAESNISNLLTTLKVNFAEFDRLLNHKMSANEIKRKAIEVNSKIQVLADSIGEVGYEKRDEFVKKLIESSIAVSERYVEAEKIEGFGNELRHELKSYCENLYKDNFANRLNNIFWFNLYLYEWLSKEGFVSSYRTASRYFTDEMLEGFFSQNRTRVIQEMLASHRNYDGTLQIDSPLNDQKVSNCFEIHKLLNNAT